MTDGAAVAGVTGVTRDGLAVAASPGLTGSVAADGASVIRDNDSVEADATGVTGFVEAVEADGSAVAAATGLAGSVVRDKDFAESVEADGLAVTRDKGSVEADGASVIRDNDSVEAVEADGSAVASATGVDGARILSLLGLAKRAGRLVTGEELVTKAIQQGRARLVFIASDASANLTKKISNKAVTYHVTVSQLFSEIELSQAIGSARKVLAVADDGFAKKMETLLMM